MGFLLLVFSPPPHEAQRPDFYLPTVEFLEAIRPQCAGLMAGLSADPISVAATDARIRKALRQRVPMRFPDTTTLEDMIRYIQQATRSPDGKMIPIDVDRIGLLVAERA